MATVAGKASDHNYHVDAVNMREHVNSVNRNVKAMEKVK